MFGDGRCCDDASTTLVERAGTTDGDGMGVSASAAWGRTRAFDGGGTCASATHEEKVGASGGGTHHVGGEGRIECRNRMTEDEEVGGWEPTMNGDHRQGKPLETNGGDICCQP